MSFVESAIERQRKKHQTDTAAAPAPEIAEATDITTEIKIQPASLTKPGAKPMPQQTADLLVRAASPSSPEPNVSDTWIGQLLLNAGAIHDEDIKQIVQAQESSHQRFGETAVALGLVTPQDIQRAMARQFSFPYVQAGQSGFSTALYAAYQPMSAASEALRGLRSQLMLRWFRDQSKTLAIFGARSGTGASTLAANLAIVFAQLGERTLLVDANLRAPRLHSLFGFEHSPNGLSNVLAGRNSLKEVLQPAPPFENLSLLCAGAPPPNPQELLGRVNFAYVMETAPAIFDVVIVDAAPVLECADAQLVAARTGACLLVARRNETRLADVESAKAQLAPSGTTLLGAVMCG